MMDSDLREALCHLIRGAGVKRGTHSLIVEGRKVTEEFLAVLEEEGFRRMLVEQVDIEPGRRAPAFYLEEDRVHFGWVFWEAFFPGRMRKIFGSVLRNEKSDWAVVLGRRDPIYVNCSLEEGMDLERPSEF